MQFHLMHVSLHQNFTLHAVIRKIVILIQLYPVKSLKGKEHLTVDCNIESPYEKFQACLIIYDKVVSVFVSMPSGY